VGKLSFVLVGMVLKKQFNIYFECLLFDKAAGWEGGSKMCRGRAEI